MPSPMDRHRARRREENIARTAAFVSLAPMVRALEGFGLEVDIQVEDDLDIRLYPRRQVTISGSREAIARARAAFPDYFPLSKSKD